MKEIGAELGVMESYVSKIHARGASENEGCDDGRRGPTLLGWE